ncbi:MAG: glutathione S-transferase family protein [Pseudomonadota bacterium]
MGIKFSCASGSPYAWRVWLALEHKALPYELEEMTFSTGDLQQPELVAMQARKVKIFDDDGFAMYESQVILEYLEDAYPNSGNRLFPADVRQRGLVRRYIRYADVYLAQALETMVDEILFKTAAKWNSELIIEARTTFMKEFVYFEQQLQLNGDFLMGTPGAADFSLYPMIAVALRLELTEPDLAIRDGIGPRVRAWMKRMEALPYYEKTYPPHWRLGS